MVAPYNTVREICSGTQYSIGNDRHGFYQKIVFLRDSLAKPPTVGMWAPFGFININRLVKRVAWLSPV